MTESPTPFDKQQFETNVLAASAVNDLLVWLNEADCNSGDPHFEQMCQSLVELHNSNQMDFISHIMSEKLESDSRRDFWSTQHLFTKLAPDLKVDVDALIAAVNRLVTTAGQDLADDQPNSALREWLKRRPKETAKLLERLKRGDDHLLPMLTFVLEAGASFDLGRYHKAAIELLTDARSQARQSAITALGRIDASSDENLHLLGLDTLAQYIETSNAEDETVGAVRALLDNYARAQLIEDSEVIHLIEIAGQNASPNLHYQLALMLARNHQSFSTPLKVAIVSSLGDADPSIKGVVDQIDFAFSKCINDENREAIATCLQQLLDHAVTPLQLSDLDSFVQNLIAKHPDSLGWLVVYWLRHGNHAARSALPILFRRFAPEGYVLNVSIDEFDFSDAELTFISRKTLGYFLIEAATAASLLISFLRAASGDDDAKEIAGLLVDPLMINFSGQAREVVEEAVQIDDNAQPHLQAALAAHDQYLEGLRSVPKIPELWPSGKKRQIQAERQRRKFSQSFKDAQSESVFINLVTKHVLLHGAGSVTYVRDFDGGLRRIESMLSSHGTSMEFPRFESIDPLHFQHLVLGFRNETFDS